MLFLKLVELFTLALQNLPPEELQSQYGIPLKISFYQKIVPSSWNFFCCFFSHQKILVQLLFKCTIERQRTCIRNYLCWSNADQDSELYIQLVSYGTVVKHVFNKKNFVLKLNFACIFSVRSTPFREKRRFRKAQKLPDPDLEHYCSIKICLVKHLFLAFSWYCSKTCVSCIQLVLQ